MYHLIKIIVVSVTLLWVFCYQPANISATEISKEPTQGVQSKDPENGYGDISQNKINEISIKSNQYIMDGESFISSNGTTVSVSGNTRSFIAVDIIAVDVYLQRWDSNKGRWIDVKAVGNFRGYYNAAISGGKDIVVVPGYSYRTRSHHWINENQTTENEYSYSTYIYVK
ncbi:hypothetical protein [Aquibacillus saliphilus]|uniref:hypothetical protein n=1 Tax=Aquibacillus saliphilus TaxID=1909422 RepID=UPI001CF0CB58|nr:hypothetical protein [Aquibacillus saliphilus]